jgi:SNF2 family DNA or RNA helicase
LRRLEKTLEFKQQMDYTTPQAKVSALAVLQTKIQSVKEQLKTIHTRLGQCNITEECPICYENAKDNNCTLTPCCHHMFCGKCILQSLTRQPTCPMCRTNIITSQLVHITDNKNKKKSKKEEKKLLSKSKQLLEFLKANPDARVLIFSRYENPFTSIGNSFTEEGISHHILSGNKDVVAATIRSFETGEKRVLFLPTQSAGAGINLVTATHVILLHAMTPDEEKQVIGRAYRLGRKDPLHVIHLVHEAERPQ